MKRHTAIRVCLSAFKSDDLVIIIGKSLHYEAEKYDKGNILYLDDTDYMISFSLGIALAVDKRVFIICEEGYFIRNLSELVQAAASKLKNLYLILLCSGEYSIFNGTPTPFDSVNSKQAIFYNMGFLVHNYTKHFDLPNTTKELSKIFDRVRPPMVGFIIPDVDVKKMEFVDIDYKKNAQKIKEFLALPEE